MTVCDNKVVTAFNTTHGGREDVAVKQVTNAKMDLHKPS